MRSAFDVIVAFSEDPVSLEQRILQYYRGERGVLVSGPESYGEYLASDLRGQRVITGGMALLFAVILSLSIALLFGSELRNRQKETAILWVIGYSKSQIRVRLALEFLIICLSGFALGLVLGYAGHSTVDTLVMQRGGMVSEIGLFDLLMSLLIPVAAMTIVYSRAVASLRGDPVAVVEGAGVDRRKDQRGDE